VKILYQSGIVDILMSNNEPEPDEVSQDWITNARQYIDVTELDMCPEFTGSRLGTYYITLLGRANTSLFDFVTYTDEATIDEPPRKGAVPEKCEGELSETHTCFSPGMTFELRGAFRQSFHNMKLEYPVKKGECYTLTIYLQADQGDGGLCGSFDDKFPSYYTGAPDYQSELAGSDYIITQRCYDEDGTGAFYSAVFAWAGAPYYAVRFTVNKEPFLLRSSELSPYQYGYSASRTLVGQCPGTSPQTWMCQDWRSYCAQFWIVYPSEDPNLFWPPPAAWSATSSPVSAALFSQLTDYSVPVRNISKNSLSVVVVLKNTLFGRESNYITEDQLKQCKFISRARAFNKNGQALLGTATVKPKKTGCTQTLAQPVIDTGRDLVAKLQTSQSFSEVLKLSFEIDTLKFTSGWTQCSEQANDLLVRKKVEERGLSTVCTVSNTSSPAYLNDPCCNAGLSGTQCCIPRKKTLETIKSLGVNETLIEDICQNSDCVESYISEWQFLTRSDLRCSSFSSDEYPAIISSGTAFYAKCKSKYNIDNLALGNVYCTSDAQCEFGEVKNECNKITNICFPSRETEIATVMCIADGMDIYTEFYFKEALNLPGRKNSEEFLNALVEGVTTKDCRNNYGHGDSLASSVQFKVTEKSCANARGCVNSLATCLDRSCEISPSVCLTTCQPNWVDLPSDEQTCEDQKKCNWISESCDSRSGNCHDVCDKSDKESDDFFCSYCYNDAHCVEIPSAKTKKACDDLEACYLPDGTIDFLSKDKCEKQQTCTEPCHDGFSCSSKNNADNLCVKDGVSQEDCKGDWRSDLELCVLPRLSPQLCGEANGIWMSCASLTLDECEACYAGDASCPTNQTLLSCQVVPRTPCDDKKKCESSGGSCSDADFYSSFGTRSDDFGACIYDYVPATSFGGVFPVCYFGDLTPEGCATAGTEASCPGTGGHWRALASSKKECERSQGCAIYYQVDAFAPMTSKNCDKCGKETDSYYEWRNAKWIQGQPIKLTWKKREVVSLYEWRPTIDFDILYSLLSASIESTIFADLSSQAFCDFNAQSTILEVVSCSCDSTQDSSSCFQENSKEVVVGAGIPCIGLGSDVQTAFSSVSVSEDAVDLDSSERCVTMILSFRSIFTLQKSEQQPFSPLLRVREFDSFNVVRNGDKAIVGRVMSNGVVIDKTSKLDSYEVCLVRSDASGKPKEKFDTWDLGVIFKLNGEEFLKPLGVKVKNQKGDTICFEVENPKDSETYFLILREHDWEKTSGSLYGSQSAAWWTFAALYTFLAVMTVITVILHFFGFKLHFYFLGLFCSLAVMCIIRAIYFYLLAAREFDDQSELAVAYFLVEFPTLLYFTAFSCLGAFWIFLIYIHAQSTGQKMVLFFTLFFNLFLYLIFIILLILYQTLPSDTKSECPNRIPAEEDNTSQKIITVVYQSFMAGVSLVIAIIVFIFGGKLFLGLKRKDFEGKIALVTVVCCAGLLLHCAFILFLSVELEENHFTIIVLMIVLSELLPIFIITLQFSLLRKPSKRMPSYNRRFNFIKTFVTRGGATTPSQTSASNTNTSSATSPNRTQGEVGSSTSG
jgi:hypothetical protein